MITQVHTDNRVHADAKLREEVENAVKGAWTTWPTESSVSKFISVTRAATSSLTTKSAA